MAGECWQIIVPSVAAAKQYLFTHRLPSEGHLTLPSRINEAASNPIGIRCVAMSRRLNTRFYTDPFRRWFAYAVRRKMLVVIRYGLIENRELSFSLWSLIVRRPFWPEKNRTTTSMRKKKQYKNQWRIARNLLGFSGLVRLCNINGINNSAPASLFSHHTQPFQVLPSLSSCAGGLSILSMNISISFVSILFFVYCLAFCILIKTAWICSEWTKLWSARKEIKRETDRVRLVRER